VLEDLLKAQGTATPDKLRILLQESVQDVLNPLDGLYQRRRLVQGVLQLSAESACKEAKHLRVEAEPVDLLIADVRCLSRSVAECPENYPENLWVVPVGFDDSVAANDSLLFRIVAVNLREVDQELVSELGHRLLGIIL
jgi:hypothetical protein